jgi:hypothetical protein
MVRSLVGVLVLIGLGCGGAQEEVNNVWSASCTVYCGADTQTADLTFCWPTGDDPAVASVEAVADCQTATCASGAALRCSCTAAEGWETCERQGDLLNFTFHPVDSCGGSCGAGEVCLEGLCYPA